VRDHCRQHRLHVLRQHGPAVRQVGPRLRGTEQTLAGARRQSEFQIRALAGARDQRLGVIEQRIGDVHGAHRALHA